MSVFRHRSMGAGRVSEMPRERVRCKNFTSEVRVKGAGPPFAIRCGDARLRDDAAVCVVVGCRVG
jgi:hypothetical protein